MTEYDILILFLGFATTVSPIFGPSFGFATAVSPIFGPSFGLSRYFGLSTRLDRMIT